MVCFMTFFKSNFWHMHPKELKPISLYLTSDKNNQLKTSDSTQANSMLTKTHGSFLSVHPFFYEQVSGEAFFFFRKRRPQINWLVCKAHHLLTSCKAEVARHFGACMKIYSNGMSGFSDPLILSGGHTYSNMTQFFTVIISLLSSCTTDVHSRLQMYPSST